MKQPWNFLFAATILVLLAWPQPALAKGVSPANCQKIRNAVATYGITLVLIGAKWRGYTDAQVAYARRVCRV